ncbi:MAG: DMT family transporter [Candidatus Obscuribacterales bacterium]|nr:DMT family transporter [Candidatus Obscuribacterales bacterium]
MSNQGFIVTAWVSLVLLAASIEPIIVKLGYSASCTPFQLLAIKNIVAAIVVLPVTRVWRWVGLKGISKIAGVSTLLLLNNLFVLLGLQSLPAVMVVTLLASTPALVAFINQWLGRDKLDFKFWVGFVLCLTGVAFTVEVNSIGFATAGIGYIALAILCSALYRVRMEDVTAKYSPLVVSNYIFLINACVTAVFLLPLIGNLPQTAWPIGMWMGLAGAIANVAFLMALFLVGSTRISIITMLQPPVVIVAASMILKEPLTIMQIAGIAMVMLGIYMAHVRRIKKEAVPSQTIEALPEAALVGRD